MSSRHLGIVGVKSYRIVVVVVIAEMILEEKKAFINSRFFILKGSIRHSINLIHFGSTSFMSNMAITILPCKIKSKQLGSFHIIYWCWMILMGEAIDFLHNIGGGIITVYVKL